MRPILTIVLLLGLLPPLTLNAQDPRLEGLEAELEAVLDTWRAPGFAVAIVDRDSVIYARGFGYRDHEAKLPATENTLFAIGSCTKAFTTGLLGLLQAEDKLAFDEAPSAYIPEFRFKQDHLNAHATVRDIITHRTGLPRHDFSWYLFPSADKDSLIARIPYMDTFAGLRERYYYNNFMFLTQGVIAERITGKSWEENIREHFFEPLDMRTSNVSIPELQASKEPALGYVLRQDSLIERTDYYRISGMAPAGSINSSVREMGNWLITWINGGKFGEQEVLPASYVQEAMSTQMVTGNGLPSADHPDLHMRAYGFGWFLSSYRGHYRVEHGGNIDGFSANTCFFPTDSIGVVVLTNQGGSSVPSVVRNLVADRMLGLEAIDWNGFLRKNYEESRQSQREATAAAREGQVQGTQPSHVAAEYTGSYANPGYGEFRIELRNDSLIAHFPLSSYWMRHYHYDQFELLEITPTGVDTTVGPNEPRAHFYTLGTGAIGGLRIPLEPALEDPIDFVRTPAEVQLDQASLNRYAGAYALPGQEIEVYTKDDGALYLFVPGQPEYELVANGQGRFAIRALPGYTLEFQESDAGSVEAVLFKQPNGTFRAERQD